ncbi:hypothetical protein ASPTUDRAFT_618942 [Aspergillus tubingensis CBS 134.48]|uniref:Uncharacterized protein n=1 Tax=Aspergillus tubingensis (strain CBS 134.48) TaxID=767770 RepID=A0A1L9N3A7_ASPTC|nr:hypothetical protein ASPTUDRAFT_618942 [Aspergillus tubingensis CBS 134.48]
MDETRLAPRHVCLWQAQHNPICHPNLLSFPSTRRSPSILFPTFPQKGSIASSLFLSSVGISQKHHPQLALGTLPPLRTVSAQRLSAPKPRSRSKLHHIVPLRRNNPVPISAYHPGSFHFACESFTLPAGPNHPYPSALKPRPYRLSTLTISTPETQLRRFLKYHI